MPLWRKPACRRRTSSIWSSNRGISLWNPYLVHASGLNSASHLRRLYINGYIRAEDCDRGEWAFRDGEPVPFGPEPLWSIMVRERGEPHYV